MSTSITAPAVDRICRLLEQRYGDLGRSAANRLREWLSGAVPYAYPEILEKHLEEQHVDLLLDAFWQVLPFGTGGRRGRVGYGPNRINPTTVAMTVQGHCEYLRRMLSDRTALCVVVANDVRIFHDISGVYRFLGKDHPLLGVSSRSLGRLACEVYAGNGIVAYFASPREADAVLSTPELSFLIGELGAAGGINLSASHNPPDDNGLKTYDPFGSQPVAPEDQHLIDAMEKARDIRSLPFEQALDRGMIREIPAGPHEKYIQIYLNLYGKVYAAQPNLPIVYTPLCGCGLTTVGEVLERLGFPVLTPPEERPDGTFAVIPFRAPNPEVPQATAPARAFASAHGSSIVLSSDPDADRVGLEIRLADGSWYHFDGNQIAAVLCYFLMLDPHGPQRRGLVIETLVTTKILGKIVEKAGQSCLIDDLLVGFKYVADVLKTLERHGKRGNVVCSPEQLVLATEESHGVVAVPTIRDKDSTPACMYLAALYQMLHRKGRTLLDYYVQILEELGGYDSVGRSIVMRGAEGMVKKDRIMSSLRQSPPESLSGHAVRRVVDHWDEKAFGPFVSESDRLPRNVLEMFTDAFIIAVRPSGTEPKLKFYCQLLPYGEVSAAGGMELLREVRGKADSAARVVYNELLARIDMSVTEAALLLPDIVDLEQKYRFDCETAPRLRQNLANGSFRSLDDVLAWLREQVSAMAPGADPMPALKAPLMHLCGQWRGELGEGGLIAELGSWASE